MAEKIDNGMCEAFQKGWNNDSLQSYGEESRTIQIQTGNHHHNLGCVESSLGLRTSAFEMSCEKDDIRGTNKLYDKKPGIVGEKPNDNTASSNSTPINSQRDIFSAPNIIKPERKSDMMHVWCIDPLYTTSERSGSEVKGREHGDVEVCVECFRCHNQRKKEELHTQFGELCGIGAFRGDAWEFPTLEKMCRTCHFVHAFPRLAQGEGSVRIDSQSAMMQVHVYNRKDASQWSCNDTPISTLVEKFKDKSRIADFIGFKVLDTDPKELIYYISYCYGRVFQLDDESQFLWPLGDSPEEAQKYSTDGDELAWFVEDGVVREYVRKPQYVYPEATMEIEELLTPLLFHFY
ncbi:hypothetical protein C1646_754793 [Rhizophagus diaphanus]|nr:hypothetical protein C1646_754793 [Rhizophagus diaphanus] [Rhizophagus sp. MUCL 43196]